MKLVEIPIEKMEEYRLRLIFEGYKWDPQFKDHNTIAHHVLVLSKDEHEEIKRLTLELDAETTAAEEFLNSNISYAKKLRMTPKVARLLKRMRGYERERNVRLRRYDFHPVREGGYSVSEVNSDVPGGYAEGSLMPLIAKETLLSSASSEKPARSYSYTDFGECYVKAIKKIVKPGGRIALVHCTSYSDDRQVMQFIGDRLQMEGFEVIYMAADGLKFVDKKAISVLHGLEGEVDFILRFTPVEWLCKMRFKSWTGYFDTVTPACNHPISIYAQTKRFPLVWDILEANGISMATWRKLLPETLPVRARLAQEKQGFVYKPVYGRVGEDISIKEACEENEYKKILRKVRLMPQNYVAQKKFISREVDGKHVCIGSFTINGEHCGYYARVSDTPRIDSNAADIPVLIEE